MFGLFKIFSGPTDRPTLESLSWLPQYRGVNRPKRAITYHEKDVTALFIISIILLAGSSRDDHTNQSKRQVMCYHRNKDDFFI